MANQKVIFLDIDGVLWPFDTELPKDDYGYVFKNTCVKALAYLIKETQADLVISSTWRTMGFSRLIEMWEERRLPGKVISITPDFQNDLSNNEGEPDFQKLTRSYEIAQWLKRKTVSNYLIIDDLDDFTLAQKKHLILPKSNIGLTDALAFDGIKILKGKLKINK